MARRSYRRRRSYRKRRSYRPHRRSYRMRKKRTLKRFKANLRRAAEKKYIAAYIEYTVIPAAGFFSGDIVSVAQGIQDSHRIGDQLDLRSLQFAYSIKVNPAGTTHSMIRVMLVQVLDNLFDPDFDIASGMAVVISDATPTITCLSPYSHDNRFRYRILYDKLHHVAQGDSAMSAAGPLNIHRKVFIRRFARRRIQFSNGASDANIGGIHILIHSDATSNNPEISYIYKLNYTDP